MRCDSCGSKNILRSFEVDYCGDCGKLITVAKPEAVCEPKIVVRDVIREVPVYRDREVPVYRDRVVYRGSPRTPTIASIAHGHGFDGESGDD